MIWIDYAILAVIAISSVISLARGFIREALSLVGWIAAFWAALTFSDEVAALIATQVSVPSVRHAVAFFAILIAVLLFTGIALRLMGLLVDKTGLSGTDRTLGILFGTLRGIVIIGVLVLLAGLTPLPQDPWWRQSVFLPHLEQVAHAIQVFLPSEIQQYFRLEPESGQGFGFSLAMPPGIIPLGRSLG